MGSSLKGVGKSEFGDGCVNRAALASTLRTDEPTSLFPAAGQPEAHPPGDQVNLAVTTTAGIVPKLIELSRKTSGGGSRRGKRWWLWAA